MSTIYDQIRLVETIGASMLKAPLLIRYHKQGIKTKLAKPGWLGYHIINDREHHEIHISILDNNRGLCETLAHEICHAITEENNPRASIHGPTFKRNCAKFRKLLKCWKIELKPLFIPGTDV